MSARRNITTGLTLGLIFVGAMVLDDAQANADTVDVVASDCHIVPARGLPVPCDDDMGGWNEDGIRQSAIVGSGCAFGALNGGGPWGCAAGAVAAWGGILFNNWEDDSKKND